jgi:hypothetical protein
MRLSVRGFAEHLGVAAATVARWEDRRRPSPPRLAMRAVLDDALRLADPDVRTRFRLIAGQQQPDRHDTQPPAVQHADTAESQVRQ